MMHVKREVTKSKPYLILSITAAVHSVLHALAEMYMNVALKITFQIY